VASVTLFLGKIRKQHDRYVSCCGQGSTVHIVTLEDHEWLVSEPHDLELV
jgi:hypothetical protein